MVETNRRRLLGAIAIAPVALGAIPATATAKASDPHWSALVPDFRTKHAIWLASCHGEEDQMQAYRAALPPEPQSPGSELPADLLGMTLAEIRTAGEDPAHQAAWRTYEHKHAAWEEERDAIRERIVGPAKAVHDAAWTTFATALATLTDYRVPTLPHLAEKIEIIMADYGGDDIPQEYVNAILADVRHLAGEALS